MADDITEYGAVPARDRREGVPGCWMLIDVKRCQRCGQNHDQLGFTPLDNPADDFDWWSTCPATGQPLLSRVLSTVESIRSGALADGVHK